MMTKRKMDNLNPVLKNEQPVSIKPFRSTQDTILKMVNIQVQLYLNITGLKLIARIRVTNTGFIKNNLN